MVRRVAPLLALLVAAGCTRDLEVPVQNKLGVEPASWTLAPRDHKVFVPVGGGGGYRFDFAPGGRFSGDDARIDPDGLYTAGSGGSAQDVIQVTDGSGAVAYATVTVGQRVTIAPALTGTLPGMATLFTATGGKPPYHFAMEAAPSGGDVGALTGAYAAGSAGSVKDVVVVHDDLGDPLAAARAEVTVGGQLAVFRSENRPISPHESVTLFAIGGKPPYRYTIVSAASGSLVDPADAPTVTSTLTQSTALYTAGNRLHDADPSSVTTDVVKVTDSADVPQSATVAVPVGARMTLVLDTGAVFPGVAANLVVTGGKAPYTFGFAARGAPAADPNRIRGGNGGNRSGGTVNGFTGEYVAGASPGAEDWFQVTDATGAPAAVLRGPPVGGTTLSIPRGLDTCHVADLDGDHAQDVVFTYKGDGGFGARLVTAVALSTPAPVVRSSYSTLRVLGWAFPNDLARRGRDALLLAGASTYTDGRDLMSLDPDLAGNLAERQVFLGPSGIASGVLQLDATYASTSYVYTDGFASCGATGNDRAVLRFDWRPAETVPSGPICRLVTGGCPGCNGSSRSITAMALGDFNGDGVTDLAYVARSGNGLDYVAPSTGGNLYVALGAGTPGLPPTSFVATGHVGWPADDPAGGEWRFESRNERTESFLTVARAPAGQRDTILLRMVNVAGQGRVFATHDPAAGFAGPFDPSPSGRGSGAIRKLVASGGAEVFASVDGASGDVATFDVSGFASTVPALARDAVAASVPFSATVACFPDVNADGVPDLVVASELGAEAQVLLGDGSDSTAPGAGQSFGTRTHLRGMAFPIAVGDLDGDTFADVVAASPGAGLDVLYGGGGMLAWGPRVSTASINAVAIADVGDGRPSVVFQDLGGAYGVVHTAADGSFEPAQAMTATTAGLGAVSPVFLMLFPADLGTSAAGLDFFSIDFSSAGWFIHAILNQGVRLVDVRSPPVPARDATHPTPDQCWPLAVGSGQGALAIICSYDDTGGGGGGGLSQRNLIAMYGTRVQSPDAPPATGGAGAPSIAPWVPITSNTAAPWRYANTVPARPTYAGTVRTSVAGGPPAGTAVFVMRTDQLYVVEVQLSGDPLVAGSWNVQTFPVPGHLQVEPSLGTLGSLDPTGASAFDVVMGTSGGVLVLRRTAGGYAVAQTLGVLQYPMGIGRLAAGSPGDVVGVVTDLGFGGGTTTELVPLLNRQDGTGTVR
jgi:hypothetical protein